VALLKVRLFIIAYRVVLNLPYTLGGQFK
jgi:hypothetical protein